MYGLNNNTGMTYSQQDNSFQKLKKSISSAFPGEKIKKANPIIGLLNDIQNIGKGETGGERLISIAKVARKILGS